MSWVEIVTKIVYMPNKEWKCDVCFWCMKATLFNKDMIITDATTESNQLGVITADEIDGSAWYLTVTVELKSVDLTLHTNLGVLG